MKRMKKIAAFGAMLMLFICGSVLAQGQNCELVLSSCPEDFTDSTIIVPPNVISISANIRACDVSDVFEGGVSNTGTPPAVMFVVDHTRSMTTSGAHDVNGNRFRVMQMLIDSIYDVYNDAKIGFILFGPGLTLGPDSARDPNLVRFNGPRFAANDSSSYLPLLRLSAPAIPSGGPSATGVNRGFSATAETIIDLYRDMLVTPATGRAGVRRTPARTSGGNDFRNIVGEQSGTNISIAFEAAREAFERDDVSPNPTPKENRYIIFISDGDPTPTSCTGDMATGNNPNQVRCRMQYDFIFGDNMPTTYTVFLNSQGRPENLPIVLDTVRVPRSGNSNVYTILNQGTAANPSVYNIPSDSVIFGMTYNIRNNGYSNNNHLSNVWLLQANLNEMLELMMTNIVTPMLTKAEGSPRRMVVRNAIVTDSSDFNTGTNNFSFTKPLGLNVGDTTEIRMGVTYDVTILEIIDGDSTFTRYPDSLREFSFNVVRSAAALMPPADGSAGYRVENCKAAPSLSLRYNGQPVTGEIKEFMNTLQVVFDQGDNRYNDQGVTVRIMNTEGVVLDTVTLTLTRGTGANSNIWTGDFGRVVADVIAGNNRLEHTAKDSIVVVFRNPYVPLDTARIALPFVSTDIAFYDRAGNPAGLTQLPDTLNVTAGFTQSIYAKFFDPDGIWLPQYENDASVASKITWTTNDPLLRFEESTGNFTTFSTTSAGGSGSNVYSVTATFRDGELVIRNTMYIKVDPINAALYGEDGNPAGKTPFPESASGNTISLTAGDTVDVFAKFFEVNGDWIEAYETNPDLKSMIKWSVDGGTLISNEGYSTGFTSTAANRTYQLTATLTLPGGYTTSASTRIRVEPAAAKILEIVLDTLRIDPNKAGEIGEITLSKDTSSVKVWAIERDEFGNFVRVSPNAVFELTNKDDSRVNIIQGSDGSAIIERGKGAGDNIHVTATGRNADGAALDSEEMDVVVIGDLAVAVGPNPFVPGRSTLMELPPAARDYYKDIINATPGRENASGILMAVESPRPIKNASLRVVIYDAVGNVVFRTNTKAKLENSNTYGFVWDGRNNRGRSVGAGTYLVTMTGVQDDGKRFAPPPKKVGITTPKK